MKNNYFFAFFLLVSLNTFGLNVYLYSPSSTTTITSGNSLTFSIGADDSYGLDYVEWYLGSTLKANHNMSGYYDTDTWSNSFNSVGTFYVYAYVYNTSANSNFVWWKIIVQSPPLPDLIITNANTSTSSVAAGSNITASCKVKNNGSGSAASSTLKYYLSQNTTFESQYDSYLGSDGVSSLSSGSYSSESASLSIGSNYSPGTYYILFKADANSSVSESNENNNVGYKQITITSPPLPDLIIQNSNTDVSSVVAGNNITASCSVKNNGSGSASSSTLKYYLSQNTTFNSAQDAYLGSDPVSSLSSGSSSSESATLNIGSNYSPGTYYILFRADANNDISESNENNNIGYKQITILSPNTLPNNPSFVSAPTTNLFPTKQFTVIVDYTDPDGKSDLQNVYLKLAQNNSETTNPITIMWQNLSGTPTQWATETQWLDVAAATKTSITNGYRVTWTITLKWNWVPATDIDFYAWCTDNNSITCASHIKENRNLDYINEVVVYNSSVNNNSTGQISSQILNQLDFSCKLKFIGTTNTEPSDYTGLSVNLYKGNSSGTFLNSDNSPSTIGHNYEINWTPSVSDIGTTNVYLVPVNSNNTQPTNTNIYYDIIITNIESNTQFDGSVFVNDTAKYGIPVLMRARLETKLGNGIPNKNISFEIKINNVWQTIANDGKSYSSLTTSNTVLGSGDGYGDNFYIAPKTLPQGNYPIRVKFNGDAANGPCEESAILNIHQPKWAFIIYLSGDNDLESNACNDFYNEILQSKDNNEVSTYVLFDRAVGYSTSYGNWTDTRLFKVSSSNDCYFDPLGELDLGSSNVYYDFIDSSLTNLKADNYAMVFWGHGNGIAKSLIPQQQSKGVCTDGSSNLRVFEIRQKLALYNTNHQTNFKFQIMALDACVMGTTEVLYEFKDNTELFLASEQKEDSDGLEYQDFLTASNLTANSTKYQVANKMTNAINNYSPYYTFGCWETSGISNLSLKISELSDYLLGNMYIPSFKQNIIISFTNSQKFLAFSNLSPFYIDLLSFCNQVALYNDATLQSKCNQVTQILSSTTFRKYWNTNSTQSVGGLSIYFPVNPNQNFSASLVFYNYTSISNTPNAFTQDTTQKWDNFLLAFFDSINPTCNLITSFNSWETSNIFIEANSSDTKSNILFTEFQYSTDNTNWYPLPGQDSPDGKDWYGTNGYGLTFKISNTPQHGDINDASVWVRSRAVDQGGNYSAWSVSSSFGIDQTAPTMGAYSSSANPTPGIVNLVQTITDNTNGSGIATTGGPVFYIGWNNANVSETSFDQQFVASQFPTGSNNYAVSLTVPQSREGDVLYWICKASDVAGNSKTSAVHNAGAVLDDDTQPPTFANMVDQGSSQPGSHNFSIDITDASGVKTSNGLPKLYYRFDNSTVDANNNDGSSQMLLLSGSTYLTTITTNTSDIGKILHWTVLASDNDNSPASGYSTVKNGGMVLPLPLIANAGQNSSICDGNSVNLQATNTGGLGPFTYQWSPSTGLSSSTISNPIASPTITTTYTVTITDNLANTSTANITITVNSLPQVSLNSYNPTCDNETQFALVGGSPSGGNYSGTGVLNNQFSPTIAGYGSHAITYSFTDNNGCHSSATQNILVNQSPSVSLSSINSLCSNSNPISLTGGTPAGGTYNGVSVTNNVFTPSINNVGSNQIIYAYTDNNNCSSSDTQNINVNLAPTVSLNSLNPICENSNLISLSGGSPAGGNYSGINVSNNSFNSNLSGAGNFTITYTYNDINNCQNSDNEVLIVRSLPTVSLSSISPVCVNDSNILLVGGIPLGGSYYGTGVVNDTFQPYIAGSGSELVHYSYTDNYGCSAEDSQFVLVNQLPSVNFISPGDVCLNSTPNTLISGTPSGGAYSGNGIINGIFNPALSGVGTHLLKYTYQDQNNCSNYDTTLIKVNDLPNVSVSPSLTLNYNSDTTLYSTIVGGGSNYIYDWTPCSLLVSICNLQNVNTVNLISTVDFMVSVTDSNTCTSVDTISVNIIGGPLQLQIAAQNDTICIGDSTVLYSTVSGGSGSYSYNWSTSNNSNFSNIANPFVNPTVNTTYYLTITDGSLVIYDSVNVYVESLPNVTLSLFPALCENSNDLILTQGNPSGGVYSGPSIINGIFHPQQTTIGEHQVIYSYQNSFGCINRDTQNIYLFQKPNIQFNTPSIYCSTANNIDLNLYATPIGGQIYGDGVQNAFFVPDSANIGINNIYYTFQDSLGCSDTVQKTINLLSPPTMLIANDTVISQNTSITLSSSISGGSGNFNFLWTPTSLVVNPYSQITSTVFLQNSSTFSLQVIDTLSGCITSDSLLVTVSGGNLVVDAFISKDTVCQGENFQLNCLGSGGSGYYNYNWYNTQGNLISSQKSFLYSSFNDTMFFIHISDNVNTVKDSIHLQLKQLPLLNLLNDTILCAGAGLTLNIGTGPSSYLWSTGDTTSIINIDTNTLGGIGQYNIWIIAEGQNSCYNSDTIIIEFVDCTGINKIKKENIIIYPNPTSGKITITNMSQHLDYFINISNSLGQTVYRNKIKWFMNGNFQIDVSTFENGVYILYLQNSNNEVFTVKIIKN